VGRLRLAELGGTEVVLQSRLLDPNTIRLHQESLDRFPLVFGWRIPFGRETSDWRIVLPDLAAYTSYELGVPLPNACLEGLPGQGTIAWGWPAWLPSLVLFLVEVVERPLNQILVRWGHKVQPANALDVGEKLIEVWTRPVPRRCAIL
jgi:hypothetical protein